MPGETERLDAALELAQAGYTIEVYPGVGHRFAIPAGVAFDREASERHWTQLLALFKRSVTDAVFRPMPLHS